jgi:hypothetical protein
MSLSLSNKHASLCISILSLLGLVIVLPLFYTQISNWISNRRRFLKYTKAVNLLKQQRESGESRDSQGLDSRALISSSSQLWVSKYEPEQDDDEKTEYCYKRSKEMKNGLDVNSTLPS